MRKLLLTGLLPAILCACHTPMPGITHILGTLDADSPVEYVKITYWEAPSVEKPPKIINVPVKDCRFEAEIPNCITEFGLIDINGNGMMFIADGSTLTVDPLTHRVTSSDRNGVQSRYNAWNQAQLDWEHELVRLLYSLKDQNDTGEDASRDEKALEAQYQRVKVENARLAFLENTDNVTGAMALSSLEKTNPKMALMLSTKLSDEMLGNSTVRAILPTLEARANTFIGDKYVDFEVDGAKLSDYVGKGKTILLVFWASWCEENRKETLRLKRLYEKYHSSVFDIVSVAVADRPENSRQAAVEWGMEWPVMVNGRDIPQRIYGIKNIPEMILIGPDGTILQRNFWGYNDEILETMVCKYANP